MFPHPDNGYPSYEEALDEYDRALGWVPEEERDGTLDDYDAWAERDGLEYGEWEEDDPWTEDDWWTLLTWG